MGEKVGGENIKTYCHKCKQAFELACQGLEGAETFLDSIKNILLGFEQYDFDLPAIEEIDKKISALKHQGITLEGHRAQTLVGLLGAFTRVDYLLVHTKKHSLLYDIFDGDKVFYATPPANQDVDFVLSVFRKLDVQELQPMIDIHQQDYLLKISPYVKKVIRMKLEDSLPKLKIGDGFKKKLFQQLGELYPAVGKSNFRYLDNANNIATINRNFANCIDKYLEEIYSPLHKYLEDHFHTFKNAAHVFQTILLGMGYIQFNDYYHHFIGEYVDGVFKRKQAQKMPKTVTKPNPTSPLPKTLEADPLSATSPLPPEVIHYMDGLVETLCVALKSKREFKRYISRFYRNKGHIKIESLCSNYNISPEFFSQKLIDTANHFGIYFEKESDHVSSQKISGYEMPEPSVDKPKLSKEPLTVVHLVQISSMEECIKAFIDRKYIFENTKRFIKQFDALYPDPSRKRNVREQIQKKIATLIKEEEENKNTTALTKKNKELLDCRNMELKFGHRIIFYEIGKQKIVHGIFNHNNSVKALRKLR